MRRRWPILARFALVLAVANTAVTVVAANGTPVVRTLAPVEDVGVTLTAASAREAHAGDVVIAPPPTSFDSAAPVALERPPALLDRPAANGTGVWAVVIGIDDYPGSRSDLRFAGADAEAFDRMLGATGVPLDQRLLLTNRQAGANTIRAAAQWLVDHAGPDATAVFFFAGHIRKVSSRTEAMLGADGGVVSDAELARILTPLRARQTWLAFAGCYGGGFDEALTDGRILSAAAPANELAYENTAYGHSYFVEYLVNRAIIAQGHRTVEQAFVAAREQLRAEHPDRLPVQFDRLAGDLELGRIDPQSSGRDGAGGSASGGSSDAAPAPTDPAGPSGPMPGGGSDEPGPSDRSTPPPGNRNRCKGVTLVVVYCD